MRDPNISWVSMVEKKLGLEMDDSDDDESSDDGIGLALKIMTRHDVINMFSRFSVIVTFIGNLLFLGKKKSSLWICHVFWHDAYFQAGQK